VALGAPFLAAYPRQYLSRAFDFGRRFEQRWSVNLQFLDEATFLSRRTATALLAAHVALLCGTNACACERVHLSSLR
jgi:alpha-1,3-mannosyltransferase